MHNCTHCGSRISDLDEICPNCGEGDPSDTPESPPRRRQLAYKYFRGTFASWDELFAEAAHFATRIGPENVLNISHSADKSDGVVTVWYWEN